jgi:hypothetical protein
MDNHATEPRAHTEHKILNAHLTDLTMIISVPEVIIHPSVHFLCIHFHSQSPLVDQFNL